MVNFSFGWLNTEQLVAAGWVLAKIAGVIIAGVLARRILTAVTDRVMSARLGATVDHRRAKTLHVLLQNIARYAIDFVILLTVLELVGVNVSSLLAAAGIIGLAIGFGAQNLVRDLIGGFFIVFEDQFSVGEYVTASGVSGIVDEVGLRTTKLRDFSGDLHIIPNGKVGQVTNHSRGTMRVLIRIEVAYEEDLQHAVSVLDGVCAQLATDSDVITEGPKVLGVEQLGSSGVTILVWARTQPMEQWGVGRELNLRIKQAFDREGIEIPYPRTVLVPHTATGIRIPDGDGGPM